jgi:uncharacterized membrane protein
MKSYPMSLSVYHLWSALNQRHPTKKQSKKIEKHYQSKRRGAMSENFSGPVKKIVQNYLNRLASLLKGLPAKDQQELTKEVQSHIFESYSNDSTENEVDRILHVLDKLGEPGEVAADHVSTSLVEKGKKKKIPLYILAGILIGFIGVPLGLTGVSFLLTFILTIALMIILYYITAAALTAAGSLGVLLTLLKIIAPEFVVKLSQRWNLTGLDMDFLWERLILSFVLAVVGLIMLWLGKYLARGIRFLFVFTQRKITDFRKTRLLKQIS